MRLTDLEIEGFGAWRQLRIEGLSERLNVIYGPNEAGKTTLLEFVRSVLYGFSAERRRYLSCFPPGRGGGSVWVRNAASGCRVARRNGLQAGEGLLSLTSIDARDLNAASLGGLLCEVDEPTFNNVFAVGLDEIQHLSTLSGTAAARLLYDLTTGLDRVSLGEVLRELAASRERLLAAEGQASQIAELLAERKRLRKEIDRHGRTADEYLRLAREQQAVQAQIARLEAERDGLERDARLLETASQLRDPWLRRDDLDRQLEEFSAPPLPEQALERLDALNRRRAALRQRVAGLVEKRKEFRRQADAADFNLALYRQAPRVAALADQHEWMESLENQVRQHNAAAAELESQMAALRQESGRAPGADQRAARAGNLASLRPLARALRDATRRADEAQQDFERSANETQTLAERAPPPDRTGLGFTGDVERAGKLVTQLRRRLQLERRLEQLTLHETELQERLGDLIDRQLLPGWVLVGLGGLFTVGVALILAGWFLPVSVTGTFGWLLAAMGLAGALGATVIKRLLEKAAEEDFDTSEKQLAMLRSQVAQAEEERDQIDRHLPAGGGPFTVRLEAAEADLARLEQYLPLESQRAVVVQHSESAADRLKDTKHELAEARRRWAAALKSAGWPPHLTPSELKDVAQGARRLRQLERQLEKRRREAAEASRSLEALVQRVNKVMAEVGLELPAKGAGGLALLRKELARQEVLAAQRKDLVAQSKKVRQQQALEARKVRRCQHQRLALLKAAGATDEKSLRERAAQHARRLRLQEDRASLEREIAAALGSQFSEQAVRHEIENSRPGELEKRWEQVAGRLTTCEAELRQRFEQHGQLGQELKAARDDAGAAERRLDLGIVEEKFRAAAQRWQVLATCSHLLESVRKRYERQQQPETLREASQYLARLTGGHYPRVWTPLDEDVLYVDDAQGRRLTIEQMSRGTREQLFLGLRLALASSFSRRGVKLPLVLDDVLVNFDTERTKAAVDVLLEFAETGHQVFVFTCHEHIARLFEDRRAPIVSLPRAGEVSPPVVLSPRMLLHAPTPLPAPPVVAPVPEIAPAPEVVPEPVMAPAPEPEPLPLAETPAPVAASEPEPALADLPLLEYVEPVAGDYLLTDLPNPEPPPAPVEDANFLTVERNGSHKRRAPRRAVRLEPPLAVAAPLPPPAAVQPIELPVAAPLPPAPLVEDIDDAERYRRFWSSNGAEEFSGEFIEKVVVNDRVFRVDDADRPSRPHLSDDPACHEVEFDA